MHKTIIYSKPRCAKCKILKRWMTIKDIEFKEIDITQDDGALTKLREHNRMSLPVLEMNGSFVDYDEFDDILELV